MLVTMDAGPLGAELADGALVDDRSAGLVVVSSVAAGGSAAAQGVKEGAIVLAVNGESVSGRDLAAVGKLVRAAPRPSTLLVQQQHSKRRMVDAQSRRATETSVERDDEMASDSEPSAAIARARALGA